MTEVTQADRDAAGDIPLYYAPAFGGIPDTHLVIQRFARHREAAHASGIQQGREEAARVAEDVPLCGPLTNGWADGAATASRLIISAIRAIGGE